MRVLISITVFLNGLFCALPSYGAESWKWYGVSNAEFALMEASSPHNILNYKKAAVVENALQGRMQHWIDRLHEKLVAENPSVFTYTPKPIVRIAKSSEYETYVRQEMLCFGKPLVMADPNPNTSREGIVLPLFQGVPFQPTKIFPSLFTVEKKSETASQNQIASFMEDLKRIQPECSIVDKGPYFLASQKCFDDNYDGSTFKNFGFITTLATLSITTSLLKLAENEAQAVFVLLHEAAHYYEAHGSTGISTELSYFYNDRNYKTTEHPSADPSLLNEGKEMLASGYIFDNSILANEYDFKLEAIKKQLQEFLKIKSIYLMSTAPYDYFCKSDMCKRACGHFKLEKRPSTDSFLSCSKTLVVNSHLSVAIAEFEWLKINIDVDKFKEIAKQRDFTFYELFMAASDQIKKIIAKVEMANVSGLGYYNVEQDADRLATIWASNLGIPPRAGIGLFLTLLKSDSKKSKLRGQHDYNQCLNMVNEWLVQTRIVPIHVGNYFDPHHSLCYRAQLVERTIKAGKLDQNFIRTGFKKSNEWREFVKNNIYM